MPQQQQDNLKNSLIVSTVMHVGGLLLLYFGLPFLGMSEPLPIPWKPVPIDIVDIGEITNTRIQTDEAETAKTAPPTPPAPAPDQKPPEPPKPEPKPTPPDPKPAAQEQPDEAALPTPKAKPKPPEPPKKEEPKPAADPLASVLKNVAKLKPSAPKQEDAKPAPTKNEGTSKTGNAQGQGPALSDRLTISQEDALRRQIGGCWNMPVGARNAENLIVEVLIEMNPDRTVQSAKIVDQSRYASDPYFRSAAEAALRALRHPKCTPLELPPDQYEQWKTIRFNFDPRDML